MKTIKNKGSTGNPSCPPHENIQVMSDETEWFQSPIIPICSSSPLFIYCSRAVLTVSNFAMTRINAIKKKLAPFENKTDTIAIVSTGTT